MKTTVIVSLLLVAAAGPAGAWLGSVEVVPAEPVAGEPVLVLVEGYLADTCWSVLDHGCAAGAAGEFVFTIDTYDCGGRECFGCLAVIIPFSLSCEIVFPGGGAYVVRVTENADSLQPRTIPDLVLDVDVSGPVPAVGATWAAVKCLYR